MPLCWMELKLLVQSTGIICCLVAKSCLTLYNPMDCSIPGSSVHGVSKAKIPEWVAIAFSNNPVQCGQNRDAAVSC